jgi:hypothetical protein
MAIKDPTRSRTGRLASEDPGSELAARSFFTERTLAAYLSVSDRTIRNGFAAGNFRATSSEPLVVSIQSTSVTS